MAMENAKKKFLDQPTGLFFMQSYFKTAQKVTSNQQKLIAINMYVNKFHFIFQISVYGYLKNNFFFLPNRVYKKKFSSSIFRIICSNFYILQYS